jgi:hypothetical protein
LLVGGSGDERAEGEAERQGAEEGLGHGDSRTFL